jgi:hypothetical protein
MFSVPQLAARDFEVGVRVEQLGLGWTFAPPYEESLAAFFETLTAGAYAELQRWIRHLPREHFASDSEMVALCQLLEEGLREPKRKPADGEGQTELTSPERVVSHNPDTVPRFRGSGWR